jgi:hypothetical protein
VSDWLWVVPVVDLDRAARFLPELRVASHDVLVVDNCAAPIPAAVLGDRRAVRGAGLNHGCARSWNIGVNLASSERRAGVVLASPSLALGPTGGLDIDEQLDDVADEWGAFGAGLGWHLHAWRLASFARIGYFDERLYPVYFEDDDWLRRVRLAGGGDRRGAAELPVVWTDSHKGPPNLSIRHVARSLDLGHLGAYYTAKWGGLPDHEQLDTPFGLDVPLHWWPGHEYAGHPGRPPEAP